MIFACLETRWGYADIVYTERFVFTVKTEKPANGGKLKTGKGEEPFSIKTDLY